MKVYFIAHGSAETGMGHIMRSLSLAEAFRERGHEVYFFSKYKAGIILIEKYGFPVNFIPTPTEQKRTDGFYYGNFQEAMLDAQYIYTNLKDSADLIIIDSYNICKDFFMILKNRTKYLAYIDDLNAFSYPVDFLINGSASALDMGYEKTQSSHLFLGLSYNLLRREFCDLPMRHINKTITDVLFTTGNSDPYHMTEKIRDIVVKEKISENLTFHVIIGSGFQAGNLKELKTWKGRTVYFYEQPKQISLIMQKCDLAISAGGSTLYELAACGVPTIVFAYADNQIPQILAMDKKGLLQYIGKAKNVNREKMIKSILEFQTNTDRREKLIKQLQSLIDAKGGLRIVEGVEKCMA